MSDNPEVIQWEQPQIEIDEETDHILLKLGQVKIPPHVDTDNAERVLAVVIELVNQMVEEDIIPELVNPEDDDNYGDSGLYMDDEGEVDYIREEADAFEDGLDDYPEDFE